MQNFLLLIRQYQVFLLFVLLEIIGFWLVVGNNYYQNATFFNSANGYTGTILSWSSGVGDYFKLRRVNTELARENLRLHKELAKITQRSDYAKFQKLSDSLVVNKYTYALAKVVNNSTHQLNNYITIDKGEKDGLKKGMSVISPSGIVGKIVKCNRHFSIVMPVLHSKMTVSAQVKRNGELGSLKWDGKRSQYAKLLDVATHAKIKEGDTIQTSGYNATFPPRSMIGVVKKVKIIPEQTFYDIDVELSTHFSSLAFVYVIQDILKLEQESLEMELLEEISE